MDKKLALGQKIASTRLELDKSIEESLKSIDERLDEIESRMHEINDEIDRIQRDRTKPYVVPDEYRDKLSRISD